MDLLIFFSFFSLRIGIEQRDLIIPSEIRDNIFFFNSLIPRFSLFPLFFILVFFLSIFLSYISMQRLHSRSRSEFDHFVTRRYGNES